MLNIRRATLQDLDFLIAVDLLGEGMTPTPDEPPMTEADRLEHREKIRSYVTTVDDVGWVVEDTSAGRLVGMIMAKFHDRLHEAQTVANTFIYRYIGDDILPPNALFCEVFGLWVDPAYRRQGLASRLKQEMEQEARRRGMKSLYTHTEAVNAHVIELNEKLGYRAVRCGPIWDEIPRVSLIKNLD